ncbi:MAG: DUF3427 domain-containing protein [Bacillota bacterium]|nr:DUF3427 domain-containing protein [Bacillota bacterium]
MKLIDYNRELLDGFQTAAINSSYNSNLAYRPEFLSNNAKMGRKVLVSIEQELALCDEFKISVAFITRSGITPLLQVLKELEAKGVPGEILTTDYLSFSEPEALEKLASLKNVTLRMFRTNSETGGFHTKGYIFRNEEIYRIIIGSSNMTLSAVTRNREWNTKIVSTEHGEIARDVLSEFDELWNSPYTQNYVEFIEEYKLNYLKEQMIRKQRQAASQEQTIELDRYKLTPNKMQVAFVQNVVQLYGENADKALLCSSTGTGKTIASAFAMRELHPDRILFIVHREQIAKQALRSYKRIFGSSKTYGLLSGNQKDMDAECMFSTMQMMAKPDIHETFDPESFDVIVLDECHHAGSLSYQRIMSYFKPKFWLGMTASPDTNNYDIYDLFDHNIAYEIRLQQALEEDLLCPFHYFGITDLEINGEVFDDNAGVRNFANLTSDARVDYVLEKAEYFGYSGERVKGLIFCSRKEEAYELSKKFNDRCKKNGELYRTEVLTGEDNQARREEVIEQLTAEDTANSYIDYIFTVDIFNEGVDIPEINQVIMLRPTESPVVFIQQLGRGLRKHDGKEYVVILDFIGNYMNNFMIPVALSGDRSYNKDSMRRYIREGSRVIPGSSTIHFDEVSKKRIYASIDNAKTNDMRLIKESYTSLKYKLGRIPTILEFKEHGAIDVSKIFEKCGSYHAFLKKYEPDYKCSLSDDETVVIEYISKKVSAYKRIHEVALLKHLINQERRTGLYCNELIRKEYNLDVPDKIEESVYRNLANEFPKTEEQRKYAPCVLLDKAIDGRLSLSQNFENMLLKPEFKEMTNEILTYSEENYQEKYSAPYKNTGFQLYQKYTYEDVCRLLGWKKNMNAQNIGGYFYDNDTKTMPVFINYDKTEDAIQYEDRFVSESHLIALSKHPRKITSGDADHIYKRNPEDKDNRIFLFVRKNKDDKEAKEFYFLGEIFAEGEPVAIHMESTNDNAFEIKYGLDIPVRSDIYDYIVRD